MNTFSKKLFLLSAALFVAAAGLYIVQINSITASAYAITKAEKNLKILQQTQTALETTAAKNFSARNLPALASTLGFEKVGSVSYVQVLSASVARK